jgi:hypothetical protein
MTDMTNNESTPNDACAPTPLVQGETVLWKEVAAASADRDAHEWVWDEVEDVLDVKLAPSEAADMLRANGADEIEKESIERDIDALKAELKEKKSEVEAIAARMKDRNRTGAKGVQSRKARWKVGTCFALNTVRYVDPDTGLVVHERPLTRDERQLELAVDDVLANEKPTVDVAPESADESAVTDPDALLAAAKKGEEPTPSDVTLDNEPREDDGPGYGEDEDEEDDEDEE